MARLAVKDLTAQEVPAIADYWANATPEYLTNLGVDLNKLPTADEFTAMLLNQVSLPNTEKASYCKIWMVDEVPVGHCNINNIQMGKQANMHLHIWQAEYRRSSHGVALLKLTIPSFFQQYSLEKLVCEPYALNNAPNKVLPKLGFTLCCTYVGIPGTICFEQEVNRWELLRSDAVY